MASYGALILMWAHTSNVLAQVPEPVAASPVRGYRVPPIELRGADGRPRRLDVALADGRPVVLSFMFTSCATVCPITNQTLAEFERLLGPERPQVNVVSISIDPDYDSVQRLAEYAKRTGAQGTFYTGDPAGSEAVQRAFDVWRGDKMNHVPVFLIRRRPDEPWLRVNGLVTPRALLDTYRGWLARRSPPP